MLKWLIIILIINALNGVNILVYSRSITMTPIKKRAHMALFWALVALATLILVVTFFTIVVA